MPVPRMLIQRARVNNGLFMGHCVQVSFTSVVLVSQQLLIAPWLLLISQAEEYGFRQGPNNMYLYIWFTADSLLLGHDHRICFSPAILAFANGKTIPYKTVGVWKIYSSAVWHWVSFSPSFFIYETSFAWKQDPAFIQMHCWAHSFLRVF